jgi:sulfoxide reductase heme-binding subunit YedZ
VWLLRLRRMLGLFAFFYAVLHVVVYLWLDRQLSWAEIVVDITERPYITLGFVAFVILSVLAATSPRAVVRRLGRNWKRLHRAVYAAAVLGVLHFWWLVKADITEPAVYAVALAVLFAARWPSARS